MFSGTITKRIEQVRADFEEKFKTFYCREDFENKLEVLINARNTSARPGALADLLRMLDDLGVNYEASKDNTYYKKLIDGLDLPRRDELEVKMLYEIYKVYKKYPDPETYLLRMVDRFSNPEDHWVTDPLRLRILKQFIRYGNYLKDAGYGGRTVIRKFVQEKMGKKKISDDDVLRELTDEIFDEMHGATRAQLKPEGKFGLLKAVDDLAGAKFRTGGATKRMLYLFAMVYHMTYHCENFRSEEISIRQQDDIEKNLFRDYYTNNLLRFSTDAYKNNLSQYELDPSGSGINYKNFAEMVYLYFLVKDCSPEEKIRCSSQMIKELQANATDTDENQEINISSIKNSAKDTVTFRNEWTEDILAKSEDEFKQYISDHYDCCTERKIKKDGKVVTYGIGDLQVQEGQNTAYTIYKRIIEELKNTGEGSLPNYNYGVWFIDIASFSKKGLQTVIEQHPDLWPVSEKELTEKFIQVLLALNSFLGTTPQEEISTLDVAREQKERSVTKTKALYVDSKERMTRTSLLVAYYYLYNAKQEDDEEKEWKNFKELYEDFKNGVDPLLEASFYQKLDGRNLLDLLIVFSSYTFLNM